MLALIAPRTPVEADLIVVGGVPGAGKSTAIAQTAGLPGVRVLDPDELRTWLRGHLPARVTYRAYRPLVHVGHTLRVLTALLAGPASGRRLVVHDPATRPHRRTVLARLARLRGWTPALVYVDIDRVSARRGQVARGRVVRASSFDGHWQRWQQLRPRLLSDLTTAAGGGFSSVDLVERDQAAAVLIQRLGRAGGQRSEATGGAEPGRSSAKKVPKAAAKASGASSAMW